jgi:DNA-directed RNA polymerase specialized sigma24 family protein
MQFPNTSWTVLARATLNGDSDSQRALGDVCQLYWHPVYSAICANGAGKEDAKDLTQSFFRYLMVNSTLRSANREKGRFRTFLLTVLWRFVRDERAKSHALKRGGDVDIFSFDESDDDALPSEATPMAEALDREWAISVFERVIEILHREVVAARGEEMWKILREYLPGSMHISAMADSAVLLGMSEGGLRSEVFRLRKRCREIMRCELIGTVSSPTDVHEEIAYLGLALRNQLKA